MIGSLREHAPRLLRLLVVVLALYGGTGAAKEIITYEGSGVVRSVNPLAAMPVQANVGDRWRFRVVVDGDTPPMTSPLNPTRASYFGGVREVSFWLNDTPILAPADPRSTLIAIYDDDTGLGQPRDWFFLRWSRYLPDRGSTLYFDLELEDSVTHSMFGSTALPVEIDLAQTSRAEMYSFLELGINYGVVSMEVTEFSVTREHVETLAPITGAPPPLKPWLAAATASQMPGSGGAADERVLHAALWSHTFGDVATLQFAEQGSAGVRRIALRCGAAGSEGPIVWSRDVGPDWPGSHAQLRSSDLTPASASSSCPVVINNVASLEAAAKQRLLYLQFDGSGPPLHGQLWPRDFGLQEIGFTSLAIASDQQTVMDPPQAARWLRAPVTLSFSEHHQSLARLGYTVATRHRFGNVSLHCAPPGQDGPVVAQLPAADGSLSHADILPIDATSACGMAVNNHASLLEALARGNLYVVIENADPLGVKLRGQFPAP